MSDITKQFQDIKNIIIGFYGCEEDYEVIKTWKKQVQDFKGNVILSIGGSGCEYPPEGLTIEEEFQRLVRLIMDIGFKGIDLDVEEGMLKNRPRIIKLTKIIQKVASFCDENFTISLTLPVEFDYGFNDDSLYVIQLFKDYDIPVTTVNCMTMDYYTEIPSDSDWTKENIRIMCCAFYGLKNIYSSKTDKQIWGMLGACPMIGTNDDGSQVTLTDWRRFIYAVQKMNIGMLSFWAINRDQIPRGVGWIKSVLKPNLLCYSYSQASDLEYTKTALQELKNFNNQ